MNLGQNTGRLEVRTEQPTNGMYDGGIEDVRTQHMHDVCTTIALHHTVHSATSMMRWVNRLKGTQDTHHKIQLTT